MYTTGTNYNLYEIIQKADNGDLEAMSAAVSIMAMEGYLDDNDADADIIERYVLYLRKMAEGRMPEAYIMLGDAYLNGQGVEKNVKEAIGWYENAVDAGVRFGNECIGMLYYEGKDVKADYEKAYAYFTKDEKKKSFCTIYALGEMYRRGLYVLKNEEKACEYYSEIVYSDDEYASMDDYYWRACYRLGVALHYGNGIEKNLQEAFDLVTEAKKQVDSNRDFMEIVDITFEEVQKEWIQLNQDAGRF
jgi:TPR repeat protein